jgi:DNA repair protein RecN (Recombination protein N)
VERCPVMLAVKLFWLIFKTTYVNFDEIDTGVSGEIAIKMGEIMKDMSTICKFLHTHLPQIAAKGNVHFKVFKSTIGDDTQSELKVLTQKSAW